MEIATLLLGMVIGVALVVLGMWMHERISQ
jgi:hypothetical protein